MLELMEAVERSIPTPVRETDKDFLMPVEDTFSIAGRGTVVTGRIETGTLKVGDDIEVVGLKDTAKTTCTGTSFFISMLQLLILIFDCVSRGSMHLITYIHIMRIMHIA